jgi:hypothetical protein
MEASWLKLFGVSLAPVSSLSRFEVEEFSLDAVNGNMVAVPVYSTEIVLVNR